MPADMTDWAQRIQQARAERAAALAIEEQIIRDAVGDGFPVAHVAAALDTKNRARIYDVLNREPGGVGPPALTPVVYLRGAGRSDETWRAVEEAMWVRGWATTHERTDAWHCARGGVPVVLVDFSLGMEWGVKVGRVRAKYGEDPFTGAQSMELPLVTCEEQRRFSVKSLPTRLPNLVAKALDS